MKKIAALLMLLTFLSLPAYAEETHYEWTDKLKRGTLNMLTSPVEIARSIQVTTNEYNMLEGWTVGLVKGVGNGLLRFGAGAVDLLTFPFGFPNEDKSPIIEPEYVWEKPGVKYTG